MARNQENLHQLFAFRIPYRNRSGVVELVGRDRLLFARVENGVTFFSPENSTPLWPKILQILDQRQQFQISMGKKKFAAEEPIFSVGRWGGV